MGRSCRWTENPVRSGRSRRCRQRRQYELEHVKADVFYVTEMRGVNILDVVRVSRARHIKTITVVEGYVEGGVAIGLRVRNDKPVIVVNLSAAKAEGSDLTAQLLRVSTIIDAAAGSNRTTQ